MIVFRRGFENNSPNKDDQSEIYDVARDSLISQGLVFFGGYANDFIHIICRKVTEKKIKKFQILMFYLKDQRLLLQF